MLHCNCIRLRLHDHYIKNFACMKLLYYTTIEILRLYSNKSAILRHLKCNVTFCNPVATNVQGFATASVVLFNFTAVFFILVPIDWFALIICASGGEQSRPEINNSIAQSMLGL